MKIEDLRNTKIYLTSMDSKIKFRYKMQSLGVEWDFPAELDPVDREDILFIYINDNLSMFSGFKDDFESFCSSTRKQIFLKEVLSIGFQKEYVCDFDIWECTSKVKKVIAASPEEAADKIAEEFGNKFIKTNDIYAIGRM